MRPTPLVSSSPPVLARIACGVTTRVGAPAAPAPSAADGRPSSAAGEGHGWVGGVSRTVAEHRELRGAGEKWRADSERAAGRRQGRGRLGVSSGACGLGCLSATLHRPAGAGGAAVGAAVWHWLAVANAVAPCQSSPMCDGSDNDCNGPRAYRPGTRRLAAWGFALVTVDNCVQGHPPSPACRAPGRPETGQCVDRRPATEDVECNDASCVDGSTQTATPAPSTLCVG